MEILNELNLSYNNSNYNLEGNNDGNYEYTFPSTPVMNDLDINKQSVSYYQSKYQKELNDSNTNKKNKTETEINSALPTNDNEINDNINIRIVNVVSTVSLECQLSLRELALKLQNSEYNPKRINALIIRIKKPKTAALVFSNGKMVVVGADNEDDSKQAAKIYAKNIKSLGYNDIKFKNFKIENVVASCDANFQIQLTKLSLKLKLINNKNCSYEPDIFPGLIYHMQDPKICLLIFKSGKLVFVGAKQRNDIYSAFEKIFPLLKQYKNIKSNNSKDKIDTLDSTST
jgi:transcription initiation factor TFIID TATA-box-binding protein